MELLLSRSQKKRMLGGVMFVLGMRAKLTPEEAETVKQCKLGDMPLLLKTRKDGDVGHKVTLDDLIRGTTIEHVDFLYVASCEQELRETAKQVHRVMQSAASFEGEEVLTFG